MYYLHLYYHHAIIVKVERISQKIVDLTLIHKLPEENKGKYSARIRKTKQRFDLDRDQVDIVFHEGFTPDPDAIIRRAEQELAKVEEDVSKHRYKSEYHDYHFVLRNCEHFVNMCVTRVWECEQVKEVLNAILDAIRATGSSLATGFLQYVDDVYILIARVGPCKVGKVGNGNMILQGIALGAMVLYIIARIIYIFHIAKLCSACKESKLKSLAIESGVFTVGFVLQAVLFYGLSCVMTPVGATVITISVGAVLSLVYYICTKLYTHLASPIKPDGYEENHFKPGDIVEYSYWGFKHLGIIYRILENTELEIIHYGLKTLFSKREIIKEVFSRGKTHFRKLKLNDDVFSPERVILRATNRLGEQRWSSFGNRSDHFCFWCKVKTQANEICEDKFPF